MNEETLFPDPAKTSLPKQIRAVEVIVLELINRVERLDKEVRELKSKV